MLDLRPQSQQIQVYQGDPVNVRLHVALADGSPADLSEWVWSAWIGTTPPTAFECFGEDDGVTLYLRGSESYGLIGRYWPYDVTARHPDAGEGLTFLRGTIMATSRVTQAMRATVDA